MKRGLNPFKDVKQGVRHIVALPFNYKISYGKRIIMEIHIFHHAKIIIFKKIL
jgi:hypothetical protein